MSKTHLPFIDWLKCLGMFIIVYGHLAPRTIDYLLPPILPKQLGVAAFLFVLGFGLARERRDSKVVVFNRLLEIYLFGIAFALIVSPIAYVLMGRPSLSNYLPFVLGSNVVFNHFPANPTTWYIGTYIHAVLVGTLLLRKIHVRPWMLVLTVGGEILIRMLLMRTAGLFVAYMALPNWAAVFLLGMYYGQRQGEPLRIGRGWLIGGAGALAVLAGTWHVVVNPWVGTWSFPFMQLAVGPAWADLALSSAGVTFLYLVITWLLFQLTCRLPAVRAVRFFARNTLIVFIVHMPVFYLLNALLSHWTDLYGIHVAVNLTVCWLVLAWVSEIVRRLVQPRRLGDCLWQLYGSLAAVRGMQAYDLVREPAGLSQDP